MQIAEAVEGFADGATSGALGVVLAEVVWSWTLWSLMAGTGGGKASGFICREFYYWMGERESLRLVGGVAAA